jgi:Carboxypeptidase regulatory-like domain
MYQFNLSGTERFHKRNGPMLRLVAAICCLLMATAFTFAQGTRGTIRGKVTDPNGAVVPGATVKLIDVAKNQEIRTVTADDQGEYSILEVEPATYDVVVTGGGFSEVRFSNVKVEPNRNVQLDAPLSVGGTSVTVEVAATAEILDRETPTLGTTVEQRRVEGLPLNGRNPLDLALLQPGVAPVFQPTAGVLGFGTGLGIRVNGSRGVENNVQLDGSNNNEVPVGGLASGQPRPDAIQEFRVLTANFEAEFGRNTGSVINFVTKSGTNDFHGNARIFYRPTFLSAARYFDNQRTTPLRGTNDFRRTFERKEIGGNIGGPIYLPRFGEGGDPVHSGKNRSFFFVDYERRAQLIGDSRVITGLPSAAEKLGLLTVRNFFPTNDADVSRRSLPILIRDPATATATNPLGDPFPVISGNPNAPNATVVQQIPLNRFSPIARYYLDFIPAGNATGQAGVAANETTNNHYFTMRLDHLINSAQTLNFTFNFFDQNVLTPFPFGGPPNGSAIPGFPSLDKRRSYNYVVRHTYMISPTVVNSFLASLARNQQPSLSPGNTTSPAQIGFTGNFVANPTFAGPPYIRLFDRGLAFGNTFQGPQARVSSNWQLQDSVSWSRGDHRFKFGFDGTRFMNDQTFLFVNQGIIQMSATVPGNTTGDDLADFLIGGSPATFQFGANGLRDFRQTAVALFGQDNWRVNDSLTLSLGLRWEYNSPLTDKYNRVAYYRGTGQRSTLLTTGALRSFEGAPITVTPGRLAPRGLLYVGDPDPILGGTITPGGIEKDWNNFAPRFGFAWSPATQEGTFLRKLMGDRTTVIRGGFGVFYGSIIGDTALQQLSAPGFSGTNQFTANGNGLLSDPFVPADPFPLYCNGLVSGTPQSQCPVNNGTIPNPFLAALTVGAPISSTSQAIDPHLRTPYVLQYNFTIERSFLRDYFLSLSYVGNRGRKLYNREQYNPALGTTIPFPAGVTPIAVSTAAANINSRRVNTDFSVSLPALVSAGTSDYNAFELNFQKRYSHGSLFQIAYTFSKSLTDSDTQRNQLDLVDRKIGYGLSNDDVPHRFVASFIYDLPWAENFHGIAKTVLGGWSVGGILTLQSGTPFSVTNIANTTADGSATLNFADLGPEAFINTDPRANNNRAFNADAFRNATLNGAISSTNFRRGTSTNNQFRLKNGINNFDLIVAKKTQFTERYGLELRFEAFNAFNHAQFATVDLNLNNIVRRADGTADPNLSTFGKFLSTRESRVIQLGARFSF